MTTDRRRPWALLAVALATFMTYLDNNIVNVAIPAIQRDLGLTTAGLEWVVSAYILVFAGLLLAGGRLADAFGRRRLFLLGLVVFTAASVVAGFAGSAELLITARAVQGLGAAIVTPTTLAIISHAYPDPKERTAAIGIWAGVGALALAVGPLLGGLLSQHASWGWIFEINAPIGVAVVALGAWAITESRDPQRRALDLPGIGLSVVGLTALTWALIEGAGHGWTSTPILASFAVAVVAFVAFVAVEQHAADPMVSLPLFRLRVFSGGIVALMLWAFGLFGIYFFTAIYLQQALGFSPTEAGLAFLPMASVMVVAAVVSDRVARAVGPHRSVSGGLVLMGAAIGSVALLGDDATYWMLMPSFVVMGVGGGLTTPLTATVVGVMPAAQAGVASGLFNASREIAGLLGITVIGAILTARESAATRGGALPMAAFLSGYRLGLLVSAALVVVGGVVAWFALRNTPAPSADAVLAAETAGEGEPQLATTTA